MLAALLLAIGLSLDGFGVGLSYGLRKIRIPFSSMFIIALCTATAMTVSMLMSTWVSDMFKFVDTRWLGALILISIGIIQLVQAFRNRTHGQEKEQISQLQNLPHVTTLTSVIKIQLPSLGLVIQVLRSPDLADIDKSGCINLTESLLLGCALALDALAGGLGAGLSGMPLWVILIVAATQLFMISLGQTLTNIIKEGSLTKTKFLPGALLIILGFGKLM